MAFLTLVSNSIGVNLHLYSIDPSILRSGFKLQRSKFKFHCSCGAISKYRISNRYDCKGLQPLNLAFLKQFTRTPSGAFSYERARL